MALNDEVTDTVTGIKYVVCWSGANGALLQDYDTDLTQQRDDAKDRLATGSTTTLDVRPCSVFFKQEV